jgi:peptide/nickel transport system substrate-binding protein
MFQKRSIQTLFYLIIALSLALTACGPAATSTAPPAQPTKAPPSTEPTATEGVPAPSGRVVILVSEDPDTLNPYLTTALLASQIYTAVTEPLVQPDQNGEYQPVLAERVPTTKNGDVSADGTEVTWHLRKDVVWSDNTPFTAADVVFTYKAASNADSGSVRSSAFSKVVSVEAVDDYTVVVKYSEFNSSFLDQFQWGILPSSAGDPADMLNWDFNRHPMGTGPFMFKEWVTGDHLTLAANPNYREQGKPAIAELVFQVVPSEEVRVQMMQQGDAQIMMWPGSNLRDVWEADPNIQLELVPGIYILRMFLNLSMPNDGDPGPTPPHPILGDENVRKAIALGIDVNSIVNDLALGRVTRVTSPFALGWYKCDVPPDPYDPETAKAMLEKAGWVDTNGDGIREAHGAKYAPDGTKLSLSMVGYTDFKLLEQTELVMADMLKEIGVDLQVSNVEMSVLFGSWADKAPRKMGDFDILVYDTGAGINPQTHIADYFLSTNIPTDANGGTGANYTRWVNPQADDLINQAGRIPDLVDRKALYCQLGQIIHDSYSQIFLYQFQEGHAFSTRISGNQVSTWAPLTWDVENWTLAP